MKLVVGHKKFEVWGLCFMWGGNNAPILQPFFSLGKKVVNFVLPFFMNKREEVQFSKKRVGVCTYVCKAS